KLLRTLRDRRRGARGVQPAGWTGGGGGGGDRRGTHAGAAEHDRARVPEIPEPRIRGDRAGDPGGRDRRRSAEKVVGGKEEGRVMDTVRVDKWMWAVRLFKTRGLAAKACESGRVKSGERVLKASSELRGGEILEMPYPEGPGTRVVR